MIPALNPNKMFTKREKKSKIKLPDLPEEKKPIIKQSSQDTTPSTLFAYTDSKEMHTYGDGGAIGLNPELEHSTIADAIAQKKISDEIHSGKLESNIYRGQKAYALYAEKSDASIRSSKYTGSLGPVKAPSHVRVTCRFDYAYGLCKDWRISGYCGYGDSCIFVHDRTELKTGWEVEKEWEKEQEERRKKAFEANNAENSKLEEEEKKEELDKKLCEVCGKSAEVFTSCKHLFCYKCSMGQYEKSPKCYVCGKDTKGIFNDIVQGK